MNVCKNHPEQPSIGFCRKCQSHICEKCVIVVEGKKRCLICYEKEVAQHMTEIQKITKLKCEYCGNQNDIDSKFCNKCGSELKSLVRETKDTEQQPEKTSLSTSTDNHFSQQEQDLSAPPKKSTTKSSITSLLKVSIITTLVSFIIFSFLIEIISAALNYSKTLILTLTFMALTFAVIVVVFIVNNLKAIKTKPILQFLIALCLIFSVFAISAFREKSRIIKLEQSFQRGRAAMNSKDWRVAISSLGYVANNSKSFKNVESLLDSSQSILDHLVADSCLQVAQNMISKSSFGDAVAAIDKAKSLVGNEHKVNNAYYLASRGLLAKAEEEYKKKNYENAFNYAKQSINQMTNLPKNIFKSLPLNIDKANDISSKSQLKLDQIKKEEEKKRQKELAIQRARESALEAASVEEGREMAVAFRILAGQGKKDDIGFVLRLDLTNILKEFGYTGYTVTGGTKVELYDGIVYQVECTKNSKYYYAYLKSNLSYDRWLVTGIYRRSY